MVYSFLFVFDRSTLRDCSSPMQTITLAFQDLGILLAFHECLHLDLDLKPWSTPLSYQKVVSHVLFKNDKVGLEL